ncbi:hypothetical protein HME9304_01866 [Flagellimonas maritima]|uniref:Uncharacterized protein n=1 Tax=Flagellimonas maritima TaxID=1383885 RepID=A0A2Z4LSH1_9FLAO|nr:hypothetical protein HME9304_01866 [Allomuricauda aurantiaca]
MDYTYGANYEVYPVLKIRQFIPVVVILHVPICKPNKESFTNYQ